jgi:LAS superfamily LD-carboxypeptidase LdcB
MKNIEHYIVDRYHPLPKDYIPEDLVRAPVPFLAPMHDMKRCISMVAYDPLRKLFKACFKEGLNLMGISAFRSYDRQMEIYNASVIKYGKDYATSHIAYAGTSEHQTGLAIDVSCSEIGYELTEDFENTKEGVWLRKHAEEYGFTFSFTRENSIYTGYVNEPWHIRYVCKGEKYYG